MPLRTERSRFVLALDRTLAVADRVTWELARLEREIARGYGGVSVEREVARRDPFEPPGAELAGEAVVELSELRELIDAGGEQT